MDRKRHNGAYLGGVLLESIGKCTYKNRRRRQLCDKKRGLRFVFSSMKP